MYSSHMISFLIFICLLVQALKEASQLHVTILFLPLIIQECISVLGVGSIVAVMISEIEFQLCHLFFKLSHHRYVNNGTCIYYMYSKLFCFPYWWFFVIHVQVYMHVCITGIDIMILFTFQLLLNVPSTRLLESHFLTIDQGHKIVFIGIVSMHHAWIPFITCS